MTLFGTLVIAFFLLGSVQLDRAYACEVIGQRPLQDSLENSVAIFSGRVAEVQTFTVEGYGDWHLMSFEVDRYWKAPDGKDYNQLVVFTGTSGDVCGYEFEKGRSYLVYTIQWWHDDNYLYTGLGYRNQPIEGAQEDLDFLGEGMAPATQSSWYEQIDGINIQPLPQPQIEEKTVVLSMVGIGVAVAGTVAFFTMRKVGN